MTSRTVVESVAKVSNRPAEVDRLEGELRQLGQRFPGAHISRYLEKIPQIAADVQIAPGAAVVGDVRLAAEVSIWFGCVLRGDVNSIDIRERSNLQDGTVVHLGDRDPTFVAEEVVVGHRAVLHGCRIGAGSLVGIQATVLDGAVVGEGSVIAAGSLVTAGTQVPARSLVVGIPGKVVRCLELADEEFHRALALKYTRLAHNYREG